MDKTENKLLWEKPEIFDVQPANDVIARCMSSGGSPLDVCPSHGTLYTPPI